MTPLVFTVICVVLICFNVHGIHSHCLNPSKHSCSNPFLGDVLKAFKARTDVITPFAKADVKDCHQDCQCIRGIVCSNKTALNKSCSEVCPKSFISVLKPIPAGCAVPDLLKKTGLTKTNLLEIKSGSQVIATLLKANCPLVCKCYAAVLGESKNPNFCKVGCKLYLNITAECPQN